MINIENKSSEPRQSKRNCIRRRAKDAIASQIINRNFYDYLIRFNLREEDMKGKAILDAGAGEANFAKQARMKGIDVTALDAVYGIKEGRERFRNTRIEGYLPDAVAGIAEELPFKDEKFDIITYLLSSFTYARNREDIEKGIKEGLRVLKKGGRMLIYPFWKPDFKNTILFAKKKGEGISLSFQKILEELENTGEVKCEIKKPLKPAKDEKDFYYMEITKL